MTPIQKSPIYRLYGITQQYKAIATKAHKSVAAKQQKLTLCKGFGMSALAEYGSFMAIFLIGCYCIAVAQPIDPALYKHHIAIPGLVRNPARSILARLEGFDDI